MDVKQITSPIRLFKYVIVFPNSCTKPKGLHWNKRPGRLDSGAANPNPPRGLYQPTEKSKRGKT
jgi:hypothetical protein